jgi:Rrf2 family protein
MRLEMSKKTDLVLQALAHLEETGGSTGSALAAEIGTTLNYLPQVIKPLIVRGWIGSTPGPGGGYRLCVDLAEVSVLEVIEAVEGRTDDAQCVLRGAPCPAPEPCVLHDSWVKARGALLAELATTSLIETLGAAPKKGE